jgi:hypothetical protein
MAGTGVIYCPEKINKCEALYRAAVKAVKGDSIETTGKPPGDKNFEKGLDQRIKEQKNGLCGPHTDAWKRHHEKMEQLKTNLKNSIDAFDDGGCKEQLNRDIPPEVRSMLDEDLPGDDTKSPTFDDEECEEKVEKPYRESKGDKSKVLAEIGVGLALIAIGIAVSVLFPPAAPEVAEGEAEVLPTLLGTAPTSAL